MKNQEILNISKYIRDLENKSKELHWKAQAKRLQDYETKALSYDPMKILNSFKSKKRHIALQVLNFSNEIATIFEDNESHILSWNNNSHTSFKKVSFYNMIDKLILFKILEINNPHYDSRLSLSRSYFFNFPNFFILSNQLSSFYHISSTCGSKREYFTNNVNENDEKDELDEIIAFDRSRCKISKRMRMDVTGVPDYAILDALKDNYPQYSYYKKIVEKLNKKRPIEEQIKWQFNLKFKTKNSRRYLTKIGFRASSLICSYKEHVNGNPFYNGKWRKDYLESKYGKDYGHYDVNGSIYRLTYNLTHDDFLPFDKDVYEEMFGLKFKTKEDRDAYKSICMRLMFGDINKLGSQVERHINSLNEEDYSFKRRDFIQSVMSESKLKMFEIIKSSYDSEIFFIESCLYVDMLSKIKHNLNISLVYDSFYFPSKFLNSSYLDSIYTNSLSFLKSNFYSSFFTKYTSSYLYHISSTCENNKRKIQKLKSKKDTLDLPDHVKDNSDIDETDALILPVNNSEKVIEIALDYYKAKEHVRKQIIKNKLNPVDSSMKLYFFIYKGKKYVVNVENSREYELDDVFQYLVMGYYWKDVDKNKVLEFESKRSNSYFYIDSFMDYILKDKSNDFNMLSKRIYEYTGVFRKWNERVKGKQR